RTELCEPTAPHSRLVESRLVQACGLQFKIAPPWFPSLVIPDGVEWRYPPHRIQTNHGCVYAHSICACMACVVRSNGERNTAIPDKRFHLLLPIFVPSEMKLKENSR